MSDLCRLIWCALIGLFRSRAALEAENVVLRLATLPECYSLAVMMPGAEQVRRREFLGALGGAVVLPLAARAQQQGKLPTIGFLAESAPSNLSQRNAAFEQRWAEGRYERIAEIATCGALGQVGEGGVPVQGAQRAKRCDRGVQRGTDRPPSYLILLFLGWGLGAIRRIRAASRYRRRRGCRGPASSIIEEASENP
jgi:hypothetical protein